MKTKLLIVFFLAFLIRFVSLNQSLWLDEATSANVVRHFGYLEIISKFTPTDFHPPLYYLFLKFWTSLFGYSEIAIRMPSVIFSLLTGFFVYKIGKLLKNQNVGLWSAIFFLFNPLIIYYSQEARMYMMVTFLLTSGFYYFLKLHPRGVLTHTPGVFWPLILFNLFLVLSFFTFYGSIFFIAASFIYLLFRKQYKVFFISLLIFGFALLAITPLLAAQYVHAKEALSIVANWPQVLGSANFKNLLLIPLKFTSGRISFSPKIIYYLISGIWAIGVIFFVLIGGIKQRKLLFFFLMPIILGLIFSIFTPLLQYFRFLYLIPIMSLLIASGLSGQSLLNRLGSKILAIGLLVFSFVYLLFSSFHREDWKSVNQYIKDKKVYMIVSSSDPLKYYSPNLKIIDLLTLPKQLSTRGITVIPYVTEIYGFNYRNNLKNMNYKLEQEKTFRGLTVENWVKQ